MTAFQPPSARSESQPAVDPTPIFEFFRGSYGTELLTAAVAHFRLFDHLESAPRSFAELRSDLALADRPANVLVTALRAMGLLATNARGELELTPLARQYLVGNAEFAVTGYIGLAAQSPSVLEMIERLRTNRPAGAADKAAGAAFIFRDGIESAMEQESSARHFTLALAGRAKIVAPVLAERVPLDGASRLLDVGGGTGLYSYAFLRRHPRLRAVIFDRPEVLKVAAEMAAAAGVADRVEFVPGDMFRDPLPTDCDVVLLSNILHDWDVPQCRELIARCAAVMPADGRLLIHDVFLNDTLDGPLPIALYSAALFCFTEGRAYSTAEYRDWLHAAGLAASEVIPTQIHCGALVATRVGA